MNHYCSALLILWSLRLSYRYKAKSLPSIKCWCITLLHSNITVFICRFYLRKSTIRLSQRIVLVYMTLQQCDSQMIHLAFQALFQTLSLVSQINRIRWPLPFRTPPLSHFFHYSLHFFSLSLENICNRAWPRSGLGMLILQNASCQTSFICTVDYNVKETNSSQDVFSSVAKPVKQKPTWCNIKPDWGTFSSDNTQTVGRLFDPSHGFSYRFIQYMPIKLSKYHSVISVNPGFVASNWCF